ncbi:MAG: PadR family transcriptional regulator [Chitinophagaceae bacterium]|nr:MAG: PadR family transcriptional regulator [Chitinophagaceae bacterium]
MSTNNPLFKGSLSTILLKLLSEGGRMYGYEITRKVKELSGGGLNLTEGALYPALHRLEADGLVEVSMEYVGNRPRKYYQLTQHGKKETRNRIAEVEAFIGQLQLLLNLKPGLH